MKSACFILYTDVTGSVGLLPVNKLYGLNGFVRISYGNTPRAHRIGHTLFASGPSILAGGFTPFFPSASCEGSEAIPLTINTGDSHDI